ncbi:TMhelix containing protein [Vibrio phage 1.054.O._10N.261.52.A1]|nr:TMhelix containing protein [Vibrio phage 1.054.O._10N.261.52.A1]
MKWLTSESVEAEVCNWWFVLVSVPVILWVLTN